MARLQVAPTKSSLLALRRQLAFAEEGRDLLEQKRQILVFELLGRLDRARQAETRLHQALQAAYASLRDALLDVGSEAVDRASLGGRDTASVELAEQHLMGLRLPRVTIHPAPDRLPFGLVGTSASCDLAQQRWSALLPALAELAELETAVTRLARELRKTQRRCNALSRIFIPAYQDTITYIAGALEERERESFTILKMIRQRLAIAR